MATNADIQWWLAQHPGASDATMRGAMNQSNVAPGQVARATGVDPASVFQRYQAAGGMQSTPRYNAGDIQGWLAQNPNATDEERRQAMLDHGVTTGDVAGATGMNVGTVDQRFQAAGGNTQAANTMGAPFGNTQATASTVPTASGPPPIGNMGVSLPNPATGSLGGYGNAPGQQNIGQSSFSGQGYGVANGMYPKNALMGKMYPQTYGQAPQANALMKNLAPAVPGVPRVKNYLA